MVLCSPGLCWWPHSGCVTTCILLRNQCIDTYSHIEPGTSVYLVLALGLALALVLLAIRVLVLLLLLAAYALARTPAEEAAVAQAAAATQGLGRKA
jgi:hypothetical protein